MSQKRSDLLSGKFADWTFMIFFTASLLVASEQNQKLGKVHFPVSCSDVAQIQFDRALTMLHNFWYPKGLDGFVEITNTEPDCAMAYWGVAMSLRANPLVSPPEDAVLKRGNETIQTALAKEPKTQRERDYLIAIGAYYKDWQKSDYRTRVLAYEKSMENLYLRYPQDLEAAVFYALAMNEAIMVLPADKTYVRQLKAAAILETVLSSNPDHPGALHYLIHSYDFPALADRGLSAARQYADVAPSAPHALHMPSHVFSMLGMWEESIQSNQAALGVAKDYVHAMDFMVYAYLQLAKDGEAKKLVEESRMLQTSREAPMTLSPTGAVLGVYTAFAAIPARYAMERGAWAEAAALEVRSTFPAADAITYFMRAMGSVRTGNLDAARKNLDQLQSLKKDLIQSKQDYWAEQIEIQRLATSAWIAHAEGRKKDGLDLMTAAANKEDASEKHVAMENRLWPMRELLGEMLLDSNEPAQSLKEFEASLKTAPNRFLGFYGAAKAAVMLNDPAQARIYFEKLVVLCSQADTERSEVVEAKAFLAKK